MYSCNTGMSVLPVMYARCPQVNIDIVLLNKGLKCYF